MQLLRFLCQFDCRLTVDMSSMEKNKTHELNQLFENNSPCSIRMFVTVSDVVKQHSELTQCNPQEKRSSVQSKNVS